MPLRTADSEAIGAYGDAPADTRFVIFYASRNENGEMWCPDCREVESLIDTAFRGDERPSGLVVYVGHRPEWKTASNRFRAEPWKIQAVPTIARLEEGREVGRLVEGEITAGGLEQFIKS